MSQRVPPAGPTAEMPVEVPVDPSAQAIGMLGFGAAGIRVVRRWIQQVPPSTPVTWAAAQRADAMSLAELERLVRAAPAGWGLMLAGPAVDVQAAREAAVRLGMHDAESAPSSPARPSGGCGARTAPRPPTPTSSPAILECSGCTVPLRVATPRARRRSRRSPHRRSRRPTTWRSPARGVSGASRRRAPGRRSRR